MFNFPHLAGVWVIWPCPPPGLTCDVMGEEKMPFPSPLVTCSKGGSWENGPWTYPGQHSSADCQQGCSWVAREHEYVRSGPATYLPYGGMGDGEMMPPNASHCLWLVGELALRSWEQESCFCPSPARSTQETGPCTLSEQHSRSGPGCVGVDEPSPKAWEE